MKHLSAAVTKRRSALLSAHKLFHPLIVTVGSSPKKIDQIYVDIAGGKLYRLTSLVKALDVAFQSYMALYLKYPLESERVWLFIQRVLYGIELESDKNIPHAIINSYNNVPLSDLRSS